MSKDAKFAGKIDAILLALVVLGFALVYCFSWYAILNYQRSIEYEGTMWWAADALARGQNIYDPARLTAQPWQVITYPPLFMCCSAVLMKLFGSALWCIRAVSIFGAIASAFFLYRLLRLAECSPLISAIAPAFFLGFSPTFVWNNCGRPDGLATALCLAGLERLYSAFLRAQDNKPYMAPGVVSGILLGMSCMTKQPCVVCLFTGLIFLLWCRRVRLAGIIAATCAATGAILCAITQLLTGGFLQNIAFFSKVHWEQDLLAEHLRFMSDSDVLRSEIILVILLYCVILRKQKTTVPERLPYVLFGVSFVYMIYLLGLPGSSGNHSIFFLLALSWWLALKCTTLPAAVGRIVLLSSLIGAPFLFMYFPSKIATLPVDSELIAKTDLKGKHVLSEDPYLNALTGSNEEMVDCAVFESVWQTQDPLGVKGIEDAAANHQYAALIVNCPDMEGTGRMIWSANTIDVFKKYYKFAGKMSGNGYCQQLLLPKQTSEGL